MYHRKQTSGCIGSLENSSAQDETAEVVNAAQSITGKTPHHLFYLHIHAALET